MKIDRQDHDSLNATLVLKVEKDDYQEKYTSELKKYRSKVHMKGFRKGKAPMSSLKKMYGKGLLAEIINEQIQENLGNYISDNEINLLGNPIPAEDQEMIDFDIKELGDYTFKFDIGIAPEFEVNGLDGDKTFEDFKVVFADDIVEKDLEMLQKRFGESFEAEEDIEENDIITINALELEDDKPRSKGWETEFTLLVSRIGDESVLKNVLSIKKGEKLNFDITTIEKEASPEYVKKYLLKQEEDNEAIIGNQFEGTIVSVKRVASAELNEEFFKKAFGEGDVSSKDEAVAKIREDREKAFSQNQKALTYREIMDYLIDSNDVELPQTFLKRWLKSSNPDIPVEQIDNEFADFENNLRWTLVKSNLAKKYDVKITQEELREHIKGKLSAYMQAYGNAGIDMDGIVNHYMQNQEQVTKEYEELYAESVLGKVYDNVSLVTKELSPEEFEGLVKAANDKVNGQA